MAPQLAVQCSAVQISAVQCSAVQCSAVLCSAVRCGAVQVSAEPAPVQASHPTAAQHSVVMSLLSQRLCGSQPPQPSQASSEAQPMNSASRCWLHGKGRTSR